ncbi:MAG: hypothetical protein LBU83_06530 [Bacteroidales bacterium]|jgi:hypothetical protein|nr:hypothetical protein [Bacteroidales bacterium]
MDKQEKSGSGETFEESLRQILSYGSIAEGGKPTLEAPSRGAESAISPTRRYQAAADKFQASQKAIYWLNLLRPIAVVVLVTLMVAFVYRIVNFGL